MSTEESRPVRATCAVRDPAERFADYIRLYGEDTKLLLSEQERELLRVGVMDFGMPLDEVKILLQRIVAELDMDLESNAERCIKVYLFNPQAEESAKGLGLGLRFMGGAKGVDQSRFERTVDFYQALTRNALNREEARKRTKLMIQRMGLQARRDWRQMGSRKWFDAIEAKPVIK